MKPLLKSICTFATILLMAPIASAQDTATPNIWDKIDQWSLEEFTFKGDISSQRNNSSSYRIRINKQDFQILFDAGYKARKDLQNCLQRTYTCEISGTAVMQFNRALILNIISLSEISSAKIDMHELNRNLSQCLRTATHKSKNHNIQAKLNLDITRINPIKYSITPSNDTQDSEVINFIEKAFEKCLERRSRVPVGKYTMSIAMQNRSVVLERIE